MSHVVFLLWWKPSSWALEGHMSCVHLREMLAQEQQAEV